MKLLPDTNIWIELLKKRNIRVASKFAATPADQIVTCAIVRAELMHGAEKYVSPPERLRRLAPPRLRERRSQPCAIVF